MTDSFGSNFVSGDWQNGFGLRFTMRPNNKLVATYIFDTLKQGPPNVAHGGALAAVFDEAMTVMTHHHAMMPAFTANLTINYHMPVLLHIPITIEATMEQIIGRKIFLASQILLPDDSVAASATALFIKIVP